MLFLSTGAWAGTVGLAVGGAWHRPAEVVLLTTGGAVTLVAAVLWLIWRNLLQQVALLGGILATLLGGPLP